MKDPAVLARHPNASDPNPFFRQLLSRPYLRQVAVAPHLYPPSVTLSDLPSTGSPLFDRLSM